MLIFRILSQSVFQSCKASKEKKTYLVINACSTFKISWMRSNAMTARGPRTSFMEFSYDVVFGIPAMNIVIGNNHYFL